MNPDNSPILDFLAAATKHYQVYGESSLRTFYARHAPEAVRERYKEFMVRFDDPMKWEAGTTEDFFIARVKRMAEQLQQAKEQRA